jgi:TetR/AcrR family transcriptional regulator, mexJK operon transcriptional repressor
MKPKTPLTADEPALSGDVHGASVDGDGLGRSSRKRSAILQAARSLFLQHGYLGTSMDDIAALARVSKQTVYQHFGDKRGMFVQILTADMGHADASFAALAEAVPHSQDLQADLRGFARAYLAAIMQPQLIRLRRVVIGEAERFPELAAAWYANGPAQAYARFAEWFEVLDRRGLLRVDDPVLAAQQFNWLILSIPLNEAMSRPTNDSPPSEADLHRYADAGVRVFLAAYAPPVSAT